MTSSLPTVSKAFCRSFYLILLLVSVSAQAQSLLQSQSFEASEPVNYTATTVTSSVSTNIYFLRSNLPVPGFSNAVDGQRSTVTNINGSYFWASENVRRSADNTTVRGNPAANVTLNSLNVAGKANLLVTVALADAAGAPGNTLARWETDDYIRIQYRFNGTGVWNTIGQFVGDGSIGGGPPASGRLRQDKSPLDGVSTPALEPNSPVLNQTLTDYTFAIPGSGNTLEVRVEVDQDGASEEFGFDNIRVYGSAAASSPPQLAAIETTNLAYAEGGAPIAVTSTLTVSDADNPTLSSGTVTITGNYDASEDRLTFVGDITTGNIIASAFDTSIGRLTLMSAGSTATLAQWQSALRKVLYQDIDAADASSKPRTVSFAVTDPTGVISTDVTRTITVSVSLDAASTLPYTETFEDEGEGTRYASNHFYNLDGIQFQRVTSNPANGTGGSPTTFSGIAGLGYWFGENTTSFANPSTVKNGIVTTKQVNATGFRNLHFQIRLGASVPTRQTTGPPGASWLNSYYFQLFYRIAGSNTWTAFGLFRGTGAVYNDYGVVRQDANPTGTGIPTGTQLTTALQTFDFTLPTALDNQTVDFQLVLANSDASNDFAFDQIQVTGTANNPPVIANQTRSVAENSPNGTTVGAVIAASDPDVGQTLSYNITGGNTNNTFAINATTGQLTVANSAALNYEATPSYALIVQVTDNDTSPRSSSAIITVNVTNVNELVATVSSLTNVNCNGSATGAATVTALGENTPYTYVYRNTTTNTTLAQSGSAVTGLTAGTYSVTVTATMSGFTTTTSFTLTQPTALSLTTSSTRVSTAGGSDGTASVNASGGSPAYSYDWTPGNPLGDGSSAITSLSAGSYNVTVTDSKGCTVATSLTVTTAPDLTALLLVTPATQYGTTTVSVVVDVFELNATASNGLVSVLISKDPKVALSFNGTSTLVGGKLVQNGSWTFDGTSNPDAYVLTTKQALGAGSKLSVGLTGTQTPGPTQGSFTMSATINGVAGDELKMNNNMDSERVEYFKK